MGDNSASHPCTMYKPADIARAGENVARHAWAARIYADIRSRAEYLLGLDRESLRAFISDRTPLITVKCPRCGCGPWYAYALTHDGNTLQCTDCGAAWDWDPHDATDTWNVQAALRYFRLAHILSGLDSAGIVYRMEGDRRYTEQAAVLVERFAEVFKGYRLNAVNRNEWLAGNSPYYGRIGGWKSRESACVRQVLLAYDLIRDSGALSPQQCERIDRDLVAHARDYFIEGYESGNRASLKGYGEQGFRSPYLSHHSIQDQGYTWWCIAACGALLKDRETLRSMVDMYEEMLDPRSGIFRADGAFFQGAADYQIGLLSATLGIPEILRGNLDTDIYSNPRCALLRRCYTWFLDATFPDGTVPAINDSHVGSRPRPFCSEIAYINYGDRKALRHLKETWGPDLDGGTTYSLFYRDPDAASDGDGEPYAVHSLHLPGMGLMILRDGEEKPSQTIAFLDYGPYVPAAHKHPDYLNLGLHACGLEMISEMGYNWNPEWVRFWERSPMAHNTVLEVATQESGGNPLLWCITPGPKLTEAGLSPGNIRFLALLPREKGKPLIVDIFRVSGNQETYTWALHARSDRLTVEGAGVWEPADLSAPLRNGRRSQASGTVTATWIFPDDATKGLKVLLPSPKSSTLTVSECPAEEDAIKATHLDGGTLKPGATVPHRGHLQMTRPGPEPVFVAVHVPFEGEAVPDIAVQWHPIPEHPEAVALRITAGRETFLVLHNPQPDEIHSGDLTLNGRAAVASLQDDRLVSLCLAGGTSARHGDAMVSRSALGNAFGQREGDVFRVVEIASE